MPKVKLNNVSFYYEIHGKGKPFLLIAGLGSDSSSWLSVAKAFSAHFQTIIFDNRGCGRSSTTNKRYAISDMAEDVIRLLDYLKIKQAYALGHSMGGYIAQELAINYPERISKLILASTAPISSKRNNLFFKDMYKQLKQKGCSKEWFNKWAVWLFSPKLLKDNAFIDTFVDGAVNYPYQQKAEGFKSQVDALLSFDVRDKIARIKAKTLILAGKNDILITPRESMVLAKNIHGSVFRLLNGVAHSMHIENPKLFTSAVLKFLGH